MAEGAARIAISGGFGFLGWHTACRLRAMHDVTPVRIGRDTFDDPKQLARTLADVDGVIHLAGVNRARSEEEVKEGNVRTAKSLAAAIARRHRPPPIAYANSIQAGNDTAYGRGKAAAARILEAAVDGALADVLLPNVFGEHGRPAYNSFVATFAHQVAAGHEPAMTGDREVPLLHAQQAADHLINALLQERFGQIRPTGEVHAVSEVLERLRGIHRTYSVGDLPPLITEFDVDLFNTYRSFRFPDKFPASPTMHADPRGQLFEAVRSHGGTGQVFVSITRPGQQRGDHYHLRKFERFAVIKGEGEIGLRRLLHDDVTTFQLDGSRPSYVDMPTLWTHNIRNIGHDELITMFWADQLLDPECPDQYPEKVEQEVPPC
jgi:UDP-2-acetamido-2,6-beta-L-arabino-hexul-4-ose reductase